MGVNKSIRKFHESRVGDALTILGWVAAGGFLLWTLTAKKAPQHAADVERAARLVRGAKGN